MSIDHFLVVCFSLRHQMLMRKRVVYTLIITSWIVSVLFSLLDTITIVAKKARLLEALSVYDLNISDYSDYCSLEALYHFPTSPDTYFLAVGQKEDDLVRIHVTTSLMSCTFIVMLVVYIYIAQVVVRVSKERKRRLQNSRVPSKELNSRMRRTQTKGLCTTLFLLGTFTVVWLPWKIGFYLIAAGSKHLEESKETLLRRVLLVTASMTGILDVIIYFLRSRERATVMKATRQCLMPTADSPRGTHKSSNSKLTGQTNL